MIGNRLKKTRVLMELTQTEMSADAISESFYSKVERNLTDINAADMTIILNAHQVSFRDFFEGEKNLLPKKRALWKKLIVAFNRQDLKSLKKINYQSIEKYNLELVYKLVNAELTHQVNQLSPALKRKVKTDLLQIGNWNTESLWKLGIALPLYNIDELDFLIKSVFEYYRDSKFKADELIAIANLMIGYLKECYKNGRLDLIKQVKVDLNKLPTSTLLALPKILINYYLALLEENVQKAIRIEDVLKKCGYGDCVKESKNE